MGQIISFVNMKGGVGKTTLAVNIAYGLAFLHSKKVLVVDADPQFNATQYLLDDDEYLSHVNDPKKGTLLDVFMPRRPGKIDSVAGLAKGTNKGKMPLSACTVSIFEGGSGRGRLDLMPSTLALIDVETSKRGTENKLGAYLKEKAGAYDCVIIDCPPTISVFTQASVLASDKYLVPLKPDPLSTIGLPLLERWLEEYIDDNGIGISRVGLVYTMVRSRVKKMEEVMDQIRHQRRGEVFTTYLSQTTEVAKSAGAHTPIFNYKPGAKAARQIEQITKEFVQRTGV